MGRGRAYRGSCWESLAWALEVINGDVDIDVQTMKTRLELYSGAVATSAKLEGYCMEYTGMMSRWLRGLSNEIGTSAAAAGARGYKQRGPRVCTYSKYIVIDCLVDRRART